MGDSANVPRFSVRSLLIWMSVVAFSLALLRVAWDAESESLVVIGFLIGPPLLIGSLSAPLGLAIGGEKGMWRAALIGAVVAFLVVFAFVFFVISNAISNFTSFLQ